jgi:hypothetical protein
MDEYRVGLGTRLAVLLLFASLVALGIVSRSLVPEVRLRDKDGRISDFRPAAANVSHLRGRGRSGALGR